MVKLLLALVRLHTASRSDSKKLAELKASKAASLQAVVEDLADHEVCQLALAIQLRIGMQTWLSGAMRAPFSLVLAKHTSKFEAFLKRTGEVSPQFALVN